jgi:hypothetical protein
MATKPTNQKLWDMLSAQARAKFATYPSPGASNWVHKQYVQHGGQFITTTAADRKMRDMQKKHEKERAKQQDKSKSDKVSKLADKDKKKDSKKKDKGKK